MKIKEVIEMLLEINSLEDEIVFTYWDKNYFVSEMGLDQLFEDDELTPPTKAEVDLVWAEAAEKCNMELYEMLGNRQFEYDLADIIKDLIVEKRETVNE